MKKLIILLLLALSTATLQAKPYVNGRLNGQLGNQMFEIAATYSLAKDHDADPVFPDLNSTRIVDAAVNKKFVFSRVDTTNPKKKAKYQYVEPYLAYKKIKYKPNMSMEGMFQSEKYFAHHRDAILELFAPLPETVDYLQNKYAEVLNHPNSVAVHVRTYRTDFPNGHAFFAFVGWDYFEKAIARFPEDALFIVCSDRIDMCKENLSHIDRNILFIEDNAFHEEMYLMSMCHHNVISNSTFSWWSAWLNKNKDKIVIAPPIWYVSTIKRYFSKDVIPESWTILKD